MSLSPSAWKAAVFFGKEHLNCHVVGKESGKGKITLQTDLKLMKESSTPAKLSLGQKCSQNSQFPPVRFQDPDVLQPREVPEV